MHFSQLVLTCQRRMGDMNRRSFSVADFAQGFDEAAKWLQGETGVLRNRTSLSVVANQRQYALAVSVQKPTVLEYVNSAGPHVVDARSVEQFRNEQVAVGTAAIPARYTMLETERVILIDPRPSTAAATTTLTGAHSATVTTLTVGSTSSFPAEGRLIIESEVVSYNSTTATTFAGVTRALEGTTAATHADAITVTARDLLIWGEREYLDLEMRTFYTTGTVSVTNASATVTGVSTAFTNNVAPGDRFGLSADTAAIMPLKLYEISTVDSATQLTLTSNFLEPTLSTQNYIVSSPNPFPPYCDGILVSYAASQLLKKTGNFQLANLEYASARSALESVKLNQLQNDIAIRPRAMRESGRRGRPLAIWSGDTRIQ